DRRRDAGRGAHPRHGRPVHRRARGDGPRGGVALMLGTSRNSLEAARAALVARADLSGFDGLADELLAAAGVLGGSSSLRGSLSDAGTPPDERRSLARAVFGGRVSETAVEVLGDAVGRRWSAPLDL